MLVGCCTGLATDAARRSEVSGLLTSGIRHLSSVCTTVCVRMSTIPSWQRACQGGDRMSDIRHPFSGIWCVLAHGDREVLER
jgi:hypothetical protein